jgi:hypothetical protein
MCRRTHLRNPTPLHCSPLTHSQRSLLATTTLSPAPLQNYQRDQVDCCCSKSVPCKNSFCTIPCFVNDAFFEADLFPLPPDGSLNHCSVTRYRRYAFAEFDRANLVVVEYANFFRLDNAECRSVALRTAQDIVRLAIFEHSPLPK